MYMLLRCQGGYTDRTTAFTDTTVVSYLTDLDVLQGVISDDMDTLEEETRDVYDVEYDEWFCRNIVSKTMLERRIEKHKPVASLFFDSRGNCDEGYEVNYYLFEMN